MLQAAGEFLANSFLHDFMMEVRPAFPAAETLHFIGLSLMFGSLLLVDLRALGMFKSLPLITLHRLVPVAIIAFLINLVTGVLFVAFDPQAYFGNTAFLWKMVLIMLAGINALIFEVLVFRPLAAGDATIERGALIKFSAALSLLLWCGVLILGRLIPFV
jgi:hypothetical protein